MEEFSQGNAGSSEVVSTTASNDVALENSGDTAGTDATPSNTVSNTVSNTGSNKTSSGTTDSNKAGSGTTDSGITEFEKELDKSFKENGSDKSVSPDKPDSDTTETSSDKSAELDTKKDLERRRRNYINAKRRIDERQRRRQSELQRLALSKQATAGSNTIDAIVQDKLTDQRIADISAAAVEDAQQQFYDESLLMLQDPVETEKFIRDCQECADWVNQREPEICAYIQKPLGKLVLKGWIDKVAKIPEVADWWYSCTPYEKNRVLDNYYNEIVYYANNANGNSKNSVQVPVPDSGRNTNSLATDGTNFGLELQNALKINHRNRL